MLIWSEISTKNILSYCTKIGCFILFYLYPLSIKSMPSNATAFFSFIFNKSWPNFAYKKHHQILKLNKFLSPLCNQHRGLLSSCPIAQKKLNVSMYNFKWWCRCICCCDCSSCVCMFPFFLSKATSSVYKMAMEHFFGCETPCTHIFFYSWRFSKDLSHQFALQTKCFSIHVFFSRWTINGSGSSLVYLFVSIEWWRGTDERLTSTRNNKHN